MSTPMLTEHARQRCAEMGISTKVAKRICQHPTCVYPSPPHHPGDRIMLTSDRHPQYLVIAANGEPLTVVTVLWKSQEPLIREIANAKAREAVGASAPGFLGDRL